MLLEWYRLILCLSAPSHHTSRKTLYFRGEVEAVDSSVEKVSHRKNPVIVYCAANFGTTMLCIFTSLPLLFHAYVIREHWWRKVWWYNERKQRVYSCACCDGCFSGFWKSQAPVPTLSYYIAWQPLNVGSDRIKNDEKCATTPMLCNCTCWYYLLHTLVIYPAIKTFLFPFLLFSPTGRSVPLRAEARRRIPQEPLERGCDQNGCCRSARTSRRGQESRGRRRCDHPSWGKFS